MSSEVDPKEAARSIREAYSFLARTHAEIAKLLTTADAVFGECSPAWESDDTAVTWENSSSIHNPGKWMPRFFMRVWKHPGKSGENWHRAAVLHVVMRDNEDPKADPWLGCYLFEAIPRDGLSDWSLWWVDSAGEDTLFNVEHTPEDAEFESFGWSEPKDKEKTPVRVCGYYLALTRVSSTEDVRRLVVEPLISLEDGWDPDKLPELDS